MGQRPPVILISAMGETDRVIGQGDGMPWDVPEEYAAFLDRIRGQTVIIGRRSWQIFGPTLTSADNVVVSRSRPEIAGVTVIDGVPAALEYASSLGRPVFVAGGAQIYRQALPLADRMYLSFIRGRFRGDTRFPEFDPARWRIHRREDHPAYRFVDYRRAGAGTGS